MTKNRLEAFSDGVIAIILTIMVLEMRLSLVPFVTSWMGEHYFSAWPVALYGVVLLMAAVAYTILAGALVRRHGHTSTLATALGSDVKGKVSLAAYALAIPLAFVNQRVAFGLYVAVALIWLIPDRRIERTLGT